MPVITFEGPAIKDLNTRRELTRVVSEAAAKAYNLPVETMIILLKENSPENVSVGGQLIADR